MCQGHNNPETDTTSIPIVGMGKPAGTEQLNNLLELT